MSFPVSLPVNLPNIAVKVSNWARPFALINKSTDLLAVSELPIKDVRLIMACGLKPFSDARPICKVLLSVWSFTFKTSSDATLFNAFVATDASLILESKDSLTVVLKVSSDKLLLIPITSVKVLLFATFNLSISDFLFICKSFISFSVFANLIFLSYCSLTESNNCWFWLIASNPNWTPAASSFAFSFFWLKNCLTLS